MNIDILSKVHQKLLSRGKLRMTMVFPELEFTETDRKLGLLQYAQDNGKLQPHFQTTRFVYYNMTAYPSAKRLWPELMGLTKRVIVLENAITNKSFDDSEDYPSMEELDREEVYQEIIEHLVKQNLECFDEFQKTKWFQRVFAYSRWQYLLKKADWKLIDHIHYKIVAGELAGWSTNVFDNYITEDMLEFTTGKGDMWWSEMLAGAISCGKFDLAQLVMDKGHIFVD